MEKRADHIYTCARCRTDEDKADALFYSEAM